MHDESRATFRNVIETTVVWSCDLLTASAQAKRKSTRPHFLLACLYTVTPDAGFLVDRMPGTSRVIVASACSGHGFKHSPALGQALAAMAIADESPESMAAFALERFAA